MCRQPWVVCKNAYCSTPEDDRLVERGDTLTPGLLVRCTGGCPGINRPMPWDPTGISDLVSCEKCWTRTKLQDLVPTVEVPGDSGDTGSDHAAGPSSGRTTPVSGVSGISGTGFVPVAVIEPAVGATGPIRFGRDTNHDTSKHSKWETLPVPARPVKPSDHSRILPEPVVPPNAAPFRSSMVARQRESVTLEAYPVDSFTTTRTGQVVPIAWLLPPIQPLPTENPALSLSYENGLALGITASFDHH